MIALASVIYYKNAGISKTNHCEKTNYFDLASSMHQAGYSNCQEIDGLSSFYKTARIDDLIAKRPKQIVRYRLDLKTSYKPGNWPLLKYEIAQPMGNFELWLLLPKTSGPFPVVLLSHGHDVLSGIDSLRNIDQWDQLLKAGIALAIPSLPGIIGFVHNPPNNKLASIYDNNVSFILRAAITRRTAYGALAYQTVITVDFLQSAEFRGVLTADRIFKMGHSAGSLLTLACVSEDDRLKAGIIDHGQDNLPTAKGKNQHLPPEHFIPMLYCVDDNAPSKWAESSDILHYNYGYKGQVKQVVSEIKKRLGSTRACGNNQCEVDENHETCPADCQEHKPARFEQTQAKIPFHSADIKMPIEFYRNNYFPIKSSETTREKIERVTGIKQIDSYIKTPPEILFDKSEKRYGHRAKRREYCLGKAGSITTHIIRSKFWKRSARLVVSVQSQGLAHNNLDPSALYRDILDSGFDVLEIELKNTDVTEQNAADAIRLFPFGFSIAGFHVWEILKIIDSYTLEFGKPRRGITLIGTQGGSFTALLAGNLSTNVDSICSGTLEAGDIFYKDIQEGLERHPSMHHAQYIFDLAVFGDMKELTENGLKKTLQFKENAKAVPRIIKFLNSI